MLFWAESFKVSWVHTDAHLAGMIDLPSWGNWPVLSLVIPAMGELEAAVLCVPSNTIALTVPRELPYPATLAIYHVVDAAQPSHDSRPCSTLVAENDATRV
jgi:hypothetical protein